MNPPFPAEHIARHIIEVTFPRSASRSASRSVNRSSICQCRTLWKSSLEVLTGHSQAPPRSLDYSAVVFAVVNGLTQVTMILRCRRPMESQARWPGCPAGLHGVNSHSRITATVCAARTERGYSACGRCVGTLIPVPSKTLQGSFSSHTGCARLPSPSVKEGHDVGRVTTDARKTSAMVNLRGD